MVYGLLLVNIALVLVVVFFEYKNPSEAVLWAAILLVFPGLGLLFYLVFGATVGIRMNYAIRTRKLKNEYRQDVDAQLKTLKSLKAVPVPPEEKRLRDIMQFNLEYSEGLITEHNRIEVIINGQEKYKRLFNDIQEAQTSVHVQYYAIHDDTVGRALRDLLVQKAAAGIKVRVMYDSFGSLGTGKSFFKPLLQAGGDVRRLKPFLTHFRNHRKNVVIDGCIGYIGGMNIGEQYLGKAKVKTPWRDTQIRIQGDGVNVLQYHFLSDWFYATRPKKLGITEKEISELFPPHAIRNKLYCQFVAGGVDNDKEFIKMSYLRLITSAQKQIRIQSPYFLPDRSLLDALKVAAASGVEIELMLPAIPASFFIEPAGRYYISQLLPYGVKVYYYQGYIHAKTVSVDDDVTCVGSVNFDVRSLEIDDEICAFVYNQEFCDQHHRIFDEDLTHCIEMDYDAFKKRGPVKKFFERFFMIFAPLM